MLIAFKSLFLASVVQKMDNVCNIGFPILIHWIVIYSVDSAIQHFTGLEIATDTVTNATNIFSLATKNSSLVAKVATRFLYILDLN